MKGRAFYKKTWGHIDTCTVHVTPCDGNVAVNTISGGNKTALILTISFLFFFYSGTSESGLFADIGDVVSLFITTCAHCQKYINLNVSSVHMKCINVEGCVIVLIMDIPIVHGI